MPTTVVHATDTLLLWVLLLKRGIFVLDGGRSHFMPQVATMKATGNIKDVIAQAVAELGGFPAFVSPGDTVLIKPNYNTADKPPASTAPDFLAAAVDLVFEAGAARVIIGESSCYTIRKNSIATQRTLCRAGVFDVVFSPRLPEIVIFDDHSWVTKLIPQGKYLTRVSVPELLDQVDRIILLPCCKTHRIAGFTGALKIAVGFMKPTERINLHLGNVAEKVAEMNMVYTPDLAIMDARKCFITGGPSSGQVREPGVVLASASRTQIDLEEVRIIQSFAGNALASKKPEDLLQIRRARELGIS